MDKILARKVYVFILENINGWNKNEINRLKNEEIYCDPIFEGLCKIN